MRLTLSRISETTRTISCEDISTIDIDDYDVIHLDCQDVQKDLFHHFDDIYCLDISIKPLLKDCNFLPTNVVGHYSRPFYYFMNTELPRFGNFLSELIHIIYDAEINKTSVFFPDTPGTFIINTIFRPFVGFSKRNVFVDRKPRTFDSIIDGKNFYYFPKYIPFEIERRRIALKYIRTKIPKPMIGEEELVIHIRSGDIFLNNIHPDYIQPPYEYYEYIIRKNNYKKILLLSEPDFSNPVIMKLQKEFPYIKVHSGILEDDIAIILGARHLVIGTGSFGYMLSLCSSNLSVLYCFETHNVYYKNSDYNIIVLGVKENNYPKRWTGNNRILTDGCWNIIEKDMTNFVEHPKRLWSD